jgi:phosphoglycerate dehydrogenase-like enzyme
VTKRNLVVLSRRGRDSLDAGCWDLIGRSADVTVVQRDHAPDRREAIRLLARADLIGSTNLCLPLVDADLLDGLPRLRGIVLYATGYDHLDVDLLRARGVGLSVLPDYATNAVAEHSMAMLLALSSRLHLAHDRSRGVAPGYASLRGMELFGRTLGVVGLGRIGTRVAELAGAFGMRVIGTDIDPSAMERAATRGTPMGELSWLLSRSDVVAVCASHRFGAPPVLGREELGELRRGALLTNVTRAALVDTVAVAAAVRSGWLRGYAVDDIVLDPAVDGDLLDSGRVLQTGHSAWWKDEVLDRGSRMWGERLVAAAEGRPLDTVTWPGADVTERVVSVVPVVSQPSRPAQVGVLR